MFQISKIYVLLIFKVILSVRIKFIFMIICNTNRNFWTRVQRPEIKGKIFALNCRSSLSIELSEPTTSGLNSLRCQITLLAIIMALTEDAKFLWNSVKRWICITIHYYVHFIIIHYLYSFNLSTCQTGCYCEYKVIVL